MAVYSRWPCREATARRRYANARCYGALVRIPPLRLFDRRTERDAQLMLEHVKRELLLNPRLAKDFPEVVYPLRRLEDNARRCKGQLWGDVQTLVDWGPTRITFPTIPKSKVCGSTLTVSGLTGSLRGQSHVLATGEIIRPQFILADDLNTRESDFSKIQTEQRLGIINGDLLGMAGPGETVSCVMPCTVIAPGDLADQFLNRDKNPQWQGERTRMVYSFPTAEKLWEQYRQLREDSFRADGDGQQATRFYKEHRAEMDEGATVGVARAIQPRRGFSDPTRDEPEIQKRGGISWPKCRTTQSPRRLPARWC